MFDLNFKYYTMIELQLVVLTINIYLKVGSLHV